MALEPVTHKKGDANMENSKNRESITERTVDDVPKLKNPLRPAEEGDAL